MHSSINPSVKSGSAQAGWLSVRGRLITGFGVGFIMMLALGAFGVRNIGNSATAMTSLFEHPFAVTNALADFRAESFAMDIAVREMIAGETEADTNAIASMRDEAVRSLQLASERYLGTKEDFDAESQMFQAWSASALHAVELATAGKRDDAKALYQRDGKASLAAMQDTRERIISFARTKAKSFVEASVAAKDELELTTWITMGLALLVGGAISFVVGRSVTAPLLRLRDAMLRLSNHELRAEIAEIHRRDEIGEMAKAVQVFKDGMIKAEGLAQEQKAEQAKKEQRQRAVESYIKEFDRAVNGILEMVSSASTELLVTAQSMSATAEETSRQSTAVAAASEQTSSNVQTVASAVEQVSSSISEITNQVSESNGITSRAVQDTQRTNVHIQNLSDAAQQIGDVVKLINDIASQTNLLALNATIEAARAGDAGKGFAVVASEVKSLAAQTAKATEEIGTKVGMMQAVTGQSVEAVRTIGQTIGRINEITTAIASAVEQQGTVTEEIARNVVQAATGATEVSTNIAAVTQAATQTGAASAQVFGAAAELSKNAESLRSRVNEFLSKIRAA